MTYCIRFGEETWTYMKLISHFLFSRPLADLVVFAGVLNNSVASSEDTKVVREVTEVFLHEEYDDSSSSNDIAILKVGLISMYEKQIFYILVDRKYKYIYIYICIYIYIYIYNKAQKRDINIQIKQSKIFRLYFAYVCVHMDNEHIPHFLHSTVKCSWH